MSLDRHTLESLPTSHPPCGLVFDAKHCATDADHYRMSAIQQGELCRPGLGSGSSAAVLSLLALIQPHRLYALMFQIVLGVHFYSVMPHVSTARLRCDPQARTSCDAGQTPALPRNARDIAPLHQTPARTPTRSASDRPSSSRSSVSPYYSRSSAGSGNWVPPRQPTCLPEAPMISLHPPTGIPGLISPGRETKTYYLEIIQQPEVSAAFGSAALSRLPLAPPLVAQLIIRDNRGNVIESDLEHPYLICHLSLHSEDGLTPLDPVPSSNRHFPPERLLYGNLVSSPHHLRNLEGRMGVYFLFPDVSVQRQGRYVLQLTLMRLSRVDATGMVRVGESGSVLAQTRTRPFDVTPRNTYVAPQQTQLTEYFLQQGARMYAFASRPSRLRRDGSF
ncbi:velvet factor-domain-containing protein [Lactarius akahatsu]|uniref:Velvet factor-domain-containing protein n=1 Tax=Lactarius akahatsu TaxID=416441 RepID=A0AAD4LUG7_9AGAM|nr:velvet factor-domain-containing protein [Lactarius akahatsu]